MVELFFTDCATMAGRRTMDGVTDVGGPLQCPASAVKALRDEVVPDKMPFVLADDGQYHRAINRFLRDLPSDGCPSANTWKAYARDIVTFARFLAEKCGGKDILETVADDIKLYNRTRLLGNQNAINRASWNRAITALDKFFNWALDRGLLRSLPFTYRYATAPVPGRAFCVRRNTAHMSVPPNEAVKCISLQDFVAFRNIGLLGQLPDGSPDPDFRGRNPLRNAGFAEGAVTANFRLEEWASILRAEIPNSDAPLGPAIRSYKLELAPPTTKRNRGRPIWIPKRVLQDRIWHYIQEERENATIKAAGAGRYLRVQQPLAVTAWRSRSCTLTGEDGKPEQRFYRELSPSDRRRMLRT